MTKFLLIETCSDCPYCSWYIGEEIPHKCTLLGSTLLGSSIPDEVYYHSVLEDCPLEDCPLEDYYSERG
jgi:hypothetical protein